MLAYKCWNDCKSNNRIGEKVRYFWAAVTLAIIIFTTPPLTEMWASYAPGIVGGTELTVFEQAVVDYAFPYGYVALGLIIVFVGLRIKGEKKE